MLSLRLPVELENRLNILSQKTRRPKSFYVKEALNAYLDDMEDVFVSLDRISLPAREYYTSEEVLKMLEEEESQKDV